MSTTSKKNKKIKKQNLSDREIKELMRHDSYKRKGGSVKQTGWE